MRRSITMLLAALLLLGLIVAALGAGLFSSQRTSVLPTLQSGPSPSPAPTMPAATSTLAPDVSPPTPGTSPAPPTATPLPVVRFAVIGDYGSAGEPEAAVARLVDSWQPEFIITTGDNNYPAGAAETIDQNIGQYYQAYIAPYRGQHGPGATTNRFFPSLGNHDWQTAGAAPYLDYFQLPGNERYYDFTWGHAQLFALDSDPSEPDGVSSTSAQAGWLQERLASSSACWKFVYMHHPPFSSGLHGGSAWMQWDYAGWGADAVLAGHDHSYERIHRAGLPYFVLGLSGYPARYAFGTPTTGSQARYNEDYGALLVELRGGEASFQFITHAGGVVDRYQLTKSCS